MRAGTISKQRVRVQKKFIMEHDTLIFTRDVTELATGHIIFLTLYVNADTWSLMY